MAHRHSVADHHPARAVLASLIGQRAFNPKSSEECTYMGGGLLLWIIGLPLPLILIGAYFMNRR
jgi:hypothetical protein